MTEEFKKVLESAHTEEEKKAVAEKLKNQLKEMRPEELEGVAGGTTIDLDFSRQEASEYKINKPSFSFG